MMTRNRVLVVAVLAVLVGLVAAPAGAEHAFETTRVSVTSAGTQGNGNSFGPSVSADGTRIAFESVASNLVAGDTNATVDVFVFDTTTGITSRVSVASNGTQGNASSYQPSVSADGTRIAFESDSSNLVAGDTNATTDVFVFDTGTGVTSRVSVTSAGTQANSFSFSPSVSADGTRIAFESNASNLVAGDTNAASDVFVFDTTTGVTSRVSVASAGTQANASSFSPSVSADGTRIAFESVASNLVAGDTNATTDVFVFDTTTGVTSRVSVASNGTQGNASSFSPSVSADGTRIAFYSDSSNLVAGDTNGTDDVFVFDTVTGVTSRVSVTSNGTQANASSFSPSVSADGTRIAFYSDASNLVAGDTNAAYDVFVWDLAVGPSVSDVTVGVVDDVAVGSAVATVAGSDADGDTLSYAISAGNGAGLFTIDPVSGVVSTAGLLDASVTAQYVLTVDVSDGAHTVSVTVTINVSVADPFDDDNDSVFENDIEWLAASGITTGCGERLFCPTANVTRGQMAAFLNRALDLAVTATDFFPDDTDDVFHTDINELAESGITLGCSPVSYCSGDFVTRGQMAAFLNRAFDLPPTGTDFFSDDAGSVFEADINELAASGITLGCGNESYCPNGLVTRGQMAAFLRRGLAN